MITSNYFSSYATQIIYCALFGATSGAYVGLSPVITIDLIGLDNFINVYGFQMVGMGLGRIIGPPLIGMIVKMLCSMLMIYVHNSGALHDASGSHNNGFFFAGSSMILSGVLFMLVSFLEYVKKTRNPETEPILHGKSAAAIIGSTQTIMSQTLHSALEWQDMTSF